MRLAVIVNLFLLIYCKLGDVYYYQHIHNILKINKTTVSCHYTGRTAMTKFVLCHKEAKSRLGSTYLTPSNF